MRRVTLWVAPIAQDRSTADLRERAAVSLNGFLGVTP
jgi:hypothetical protein